MQRRPAPAWRPSAAVPVLGVGSGSRDTYRRHDHSRGRGPEAPPMTSVRRFIHRYSVTPFLKQAPIAVLVALAAVLSVAVPQLAVSDHTGLAVSLVLTAIATLWASVVTARSERLGALALLVPAVDFVALGVLRWATGSSASIFTALVVLPVVWFAATDGRRHVLYAMLGTAVVILTPFVFGISGSGRVTELIRLVVVLVVYTTVALVVNEFARQHATQLRLAAEREAAVTDEIDRAAAVQRSLLPQPLCSLPGYSVAGTCLPSATVGGDFFDWYRTDEGIAITLGDVMGKGVGAGLIAAAVRAVVRSSRRDPDPAAAIVRASEGLSTDVADRGESTAFTTLFHARFSGDVLRWADAGHGLSIVVREDGTHERLTTAHLPIGLGIDDAWQTMEIAIAPGDVLVTFSDGVLDLFGGGLDTIDQVAAIARRDPRPGAVVEALVAMARTAGHDDDVTVVALRREPVATAATAVPTSAITVGV
ncbi:regulator [Curtobacterium sp. MCBD17_028]|nr:regulator [Curtobacterium sp. MCBD17_028]